MNTLWQKVKLLIMSNFSFCQSVFKSRLLQMHLKESICWKGLKWLQNYIHWNRYFTKIQATVVDSIDPFSHKHLLQHLQQIRTFENIMAKVVIAHIDHVTLLFILTLMHVIMLFPKSKEGNHYNHVLRSLVFPNRRSNIGLPLAEADTLLDCQEVMLLYKIYNPCNMFALKAVPLIYL